MAHEAVYGRTHGSVIRHYLIRINNSTMAPINSASTTTDFINPPAETPQPDPNRIPKTFFMFVDLSR
uniref:Uncharacterized protein n=1 Tax=Steinernema glaseri TaxID=37863 RepID=A0A1I8A3B9_9BILA